jgi:hypothetical protein
MRGSGEWSTRRREKLGLSESETKLVKRLGDLYDEGARYRQKVTQDWQHSIEVVKGNVWPEKRPKYKVNAVMNFLAQVVERKTALLTDTKPAAFVTSRKKGIDPVSEILQTVIDAIFEEIGWEQRLVEFIFLEQHFGIAGTNTCFDPALDWGRGAIDIPILDPRSFVFDPFVTRTYNLNSGEYFCLETVRPTEYLRDKYHKRSDDIKADFTSDESLKEDSLLSKLRNLFRGRNEEKGMASVVPRSIVRSYWVKDRSRKDGELLYPTWREILIVGGCPVEDGQGPYIDGVLPFDMMEWDFNVDSAYGLNEVMKLEMPQVMFNKVLAVVIENAILMSNGIWVGDQNALTKEDWERLSNEPGSIVKKRPGTDLRREAGVALPNHLTQILTLLVNGIEKLSTITEVTEGRKPGQVTSGSAIEALQLAASTAIRLKARQIETLIQRIGQKMIARIFQYYTEDRVFNLVGEKKGSSKQQGDEKEGFKQFIFERDKIRQAVEQQGLTMTNAFRDYTYKVVPASSLALTKWQKGLISMQLYQAGAIDREALLEALEYPNREEILKRTIEKQESGEEPVRGPGKGQKQPKSVLRGGHKETGVQLPQHGK